MEFTGNIDSNTRVTNKFDPLEAKCVRFTVTDWNEHISMRAGVITTCDSDRTESPTGVPSSSPTFAPSMLPTSEPTRNPSQKPTSNPTLDPTTFVADDMHLVRPTQAEIVSAGFVLDGIQYTYANDPNPTVKSECGNTAWYGWGGSVLQIPGNENKWKKSQLKFNLVGKGSGMVKVQGCFDNGSGDYDVEVYLGDTLLQAIPERNCNAPTTDRCATTVQFDFAVDSELRIVQHGWSVIQLWEFSVAYEQYDRTESPTRVPSSSPTFAPSMLPTSEPTLDPTTFVADDLHLVR